MFKSHLTHFASITLPTPIPDHVLKEAVNEELYVFCLCYCDPDSQMNWTYRKKRGLFPISAINISDSDSSADEAKEADQSDSEDDDSVHAINIK